MELKKKLRRKELKDDYNMVMSNFKKDGGDLKNSAKDIPPRHMSLEQMTQVAAMNDYYMTMAPKNMNTFACRIQSLKESFVNLEITDDDKSEESDSSSEKEDCEVEGSDAGIDEKDKVDVEISDNDLEEDDNNQMDVEDEFDENICNNELEEDEFDEENDENEEDEFDEEYDENEEDSEHKDDNDIDFDADTFGDIVLETDGSDQEDDEEVDFDEEPAELDEETKKIMYDDFFDEEENKGDGANAKFNDFFGEESSTNAIKSTYEKSNIEDKLLMRKIERDNIGEKPWHLTGEVTKDARPEYSVLEENLDFRSAANQKPIETDDLGKKIEEVVLQRIKRKAFDNVERKIKPIIDPNDYREKYIVDEKKSEKSLGEHYGEEFLKKMRATSTETPAFLLTGYVAPNDESDLLRKCRYHCANLFKILDGMTNKHHTPYLTMEEFKIESKSDALLVEEATPITTSDGMMLAPEEVISRSKRDMKGQTERTVTDRKRERRRKKVYQRQQGQKEDDNLNKQLKTPTSKSAHDKASVQFVQKAVKKGHVKVLESKQSKSVKTSTAFFTALEESKGQQIKRKRSSEDSKLKSLKKKQKIV